LHALALAARQHEAFLADHRGEALRHARDVVAEARIGHGLLHARVVDGGSGVDETDVVADAAREQEGHLRHDGHRIAQVCGV
jgi:hypothetical protein